MFSFLSKNNATKLRIMGLALLVATGSAATIASAYEEVIVVGTPAGGWGLEYDRYLNNQATADQLRSLYESMAKRAAAEAYAAAQKQSYEDQKLKTEREKCEALAAVKDAQCLRDAQSYRNKQEEPCIYLQATVGNMPHANPAGACFARVLGQYDLFVKNCALFNATNMLACIK